MEGILFAGKPHFLLFKHEIPLHAHPDLHERSFDLWRFSSFFPRLSFSWANIPTYEFFSQIDDRYAGQCTLSTPSPPKLTALPWPALRKNP